MDNKQLFGIVFAVNTKGERSISDKDLEQAVKFAYAPSAAPKVCKTCSSNKNNVLIGFENLVLKKLADEPFFPRFEAQTSRWNSPATRKNIETMAQSELLKLGFRLKSAFKDVQAQKDAQAVLDYAKSRNKLLYDALFTVEDIEDDIVIEEQEFLVEEENGATVESAQEVEVQEQKKTTKPKRKVKND